MQSLIEEFMNSEGSAWDNPQPVFIFLGMARDIPRRVYGFPLP